MKLTVRFSVATSGIDGLIKEQLERFNVQNYFTFDMSVPEMVKYNKNDVKFLSCLSDIEHKPVLAENSSGIWVDQFYNDWQSPEIINAVTTSNHTLCFVSPELHGRPYNNYWAELKQWLQTDQLHSKHEMLCTDLPLEAFEYFYKDILDQEL